ncbi:hypothetical protein DMENIID0001_041590 [Sergentomyia squamirostris]
MKNNLNLYSLKERIYLVKTFYKSNCNVNSVQNEFILEFGNFEDIPPDSLIFEVIDLFEETGSVREVQNAADHDIKDGVISTSWLNPLNDDVLQSELPHIEEMTVYPLDKDVLQPEENNYQKKSRKDQIKIKEEYSEDITNEDVKKEGSQEITEESTIALRVRKRTQVNMQKPSEKKKKVQVKKNKSVKVENLLNVPPPTTSSTLKKEHISKTEQETSKIECKVCQKKFINQRGLVSHKGRFHSKKSGLKCEICGKTMKTWYDLKVHRKNVHKNYPRHQCPKCPRAYLMQWELNKHLKKSHSDVKEHVCDVCGKAYKGRASLRSHMTIHTGFYDRATRTVHYRQHTGENPYSCELCGKTTKQKQNMRSHMRHFHKIQNPVV